MKFTKSNNPDKTDIKELDAELWEKIEETGDVWHREEVQDAK